MNGARASIWDAELPAAPIQEAADDAWACACDTADMHRRIWAWAEAAAAEDDRLGEVDLLDKDGRPAKARELEGKSAFALASRLAWDARAIVAAYPDPAKHSQPY